MPRDVCTHWNSTYDMCSFAEAHCDVIDTFTAEKELNLQKYHLSLCEWDIVEQLSCVLKVSVISPLCYKDLTTIRY